MSLSELYRDQGTIGLFHLIRQNTTVQKELSDAARDPDTKQQYDFVPTYHFDKQERMAMGQLWRDMFGKRGEIYTLEDEVGGKQEMTHIHDGYIRSFYEKILAGKSTANIEKAVVQDETLIEKAFALGFLCHQWHWRDSGERYMLHCLNVAQQGVDRRLPTWNIAARIIHDTVEDHRKKFRIDSLAIHPQDKGALESQNYRLSGGTFQNQFTLDYNTIKNVFGTKNGRKISKLVKRLSKVRNSQNIPDPTATRKAIIDSLQAGGMEAVAKLDDRYHNISTIEGKPPTDQVNIALDTLRTYVPLAIITGEFEKANTMSDICYTVIDSASHGPELTSSIRLALDELADTFPIEKVTEAIFAQLTSSSYVHMIMRFPYLWEVIEHLRGRRDFDAKKDLFTNLDIIIDAKADPKKIHPIKDELNFVSGAVTEITNLYTNTDLSIWPVDGDTSISDAYDNAKRGEHNSFYPFKALYVKFALSLPIHIRVFKKSEYDLEYARLSYLDALAVPKGEYITTTHEQFLKEEKHLAHAKWLKIKDQFTMLRKEGMPEDLFQQTLLYTLPDAITIFGAKPFENLEAIKFEQRIVARTETVLGYAIQVAPKSWHNINGAMIRHRGKADLKPVKMYTLLQDGDQILLKFDTQDSTHVHPDWFEFIINPLQKSLIATQLEKRVEQLAQRTNKTQDPTLRKAIISERELLINAIRTRGWNIINLEIGNLEQFGLLAAKTTIPAKYENPRDFAYALGLEKIDQEVLKKVVSVLKNFWEDNAIIVAKAPNNPDVIGNLSRPLGEAEINIHTVFNITPWGDTAYVVYRINKQDPNFELLSVATTDMVKILKSMDPHVDKNWVTVLNSQREYDEWFSTQAMI